MTLYLFSGGGGSTLFLFHFTGIRIIKEIKTMVEIEAMIGNQDVTELEIGIERGTEIGIGTVIA